MTGCTTNGARSAPTSTTCSTLTVGACARGNCATHSRAHLPYFDPSVATRTFIVSVLSYPLYLLAHGDRFELLTVILCNGICSSILLYFGPAAFQLLHNLGHGCILHLLKRQPVRFKGTVHAQDVCHPIRVPPRFVVGRIVEH